jgi:hypothetical protein
VKTRKCEQCGVTREWPREFLGAKGKPILFCTTCRARYRNWSKQTPDQKASFPRVGVPVLGELRVTLYRDSKNRKLGGIPASVTSRNTCPPTCGFYDAGCFALYAPSAQHWRRVGKLGARWSQFIQAVNRLPIGALWRHNVAGDLPGDGRTIDALKMNLLVEANRGRRGFTFTHIPMSNSANRAAVRASNARGFTINLSADSLEQADELAALGIAPVAVVLPLETYRRSFWTPGGRKVTVCPAETPAALTCAECQLCAIPTRKTVIGFVAHGQSKRLVSEIVRSKRSVA